MSIWGRAISRPERKTCTGGGTSSGRRIHGTWGARTAVHAPLFSRADMDRRAFQVLRLPLLQESGWLRQKRTGSIELPRGVSDHGSRGAAR